MPAWLSGSTDGVFDYRVRVLGRLVVVRESGAADDPEIVRAGLRDAAGFPPD